MIARLDGVPFDYYLYSTLEQWMSMEDLGDPVEFEDRGEMIFFLRDLARDQFNLHKMREMAERTSAAVWPGSSKDVVLEELARSITMGWVLVFEPRRSFRIELPRPIAPAQEPVQQKIRSRFELRLIDGATERPVGGIELKVRLPDGGEVRTSTDGDGFVRLRDVEAGSFGVESVIDEVELDTCYRVDGTEGAARWSLIAHRRPEKKAEKKRRFVASITRHRVRSGETFQSVAWYYSKSEQDLARFNFGTDDPKKVRQALADRVGCTRWDETEQRYAFHELDDPGVIYVPSPWQARGLSHGVTHTFKLSALEVRTERLESTLALDQLRELAEAMAEKEFLIWLTLLLGADIPEQAYRDFRAALLDGSFPNPEILLVDGGLSGHEAGYDNVGRVIRVSRRLAHRAREDGGEAWKLAVALLEEFGQHLDNVLRNDFSDVGGDALLDEGVRVSYALVNLGWAEQEKAQFATFIDDEGEEPLEVEFSGLQTAIEKYLNKKEEEEDEKEGDLEFFGTGRGSGKPWSHGHESIEDSLGEVKFDDRMRRLVYFGNWLRDNSQIVDPKITRKPGGKPALFPFSREALTRVMDVLAREHFGDIPEFRVTPARLGLYRNEEHIDNPTGIIDGRSRDPGFRGPCLPVELQVDPLTHMKRYIRSAPISRGRAARDYKVKDGDTLESIAREAGITWQELTLFNFGTAVPEEVNRHLRTQVGCTRRSADGYNYDFTSQDRPGIIRIPGAAARIDVGEPETAGYVTAMKFIERSLRGAVKEGRTPEGYRLLGQGLHTLEDFYAHTNFVEVALWHLGHPVEPWVPRRAISTELPITSGRFGGLDTCMSLLCAVGEKLGAESACVAGEQTAGNKILMILLKDAGYTQTHDLIGGVGGWLREMEEKYPRLATLSCNTIGALSRMVLFGIGMVIRAGANNIDDAQTAFLDDPNGTDPTHSQLAKDHDDHPLHLLASSLAAGASKDVGGAIQRAWRGEGSANEVVATASQYLVHPAGIPAGRSSGWVLEGIDRWGRSNPGAIKQLGARSWKVEWSKHQAKNLQGMQQRMNELSGNSPAEQKRVLDILAGKKK